MRGASKPMFLIGAVAVPASQTRPIGYCAMLLSACWSWVNIQKDSKSRFVARLSGGLTLRLRGPAFGLRFAPSCAKTSTWNFDSLRASASCRLRLSLSLDVIQGRFFRHPCSCSDHVDPIVAIRFVTWARMAAKFTALNKTA